MKVKKDDEVVVIAGKDRGAKGKVLAADPVTSKVVVEGVNRVKKHTPSPRPRAAPRPVASRRRGRRSGQQRHGHRQ